jgi:hypothetical protein
MLQFPRWKVDVTVGGKPVKTTYETATTAKAAIAKAKHKLRGAVSSAGAFRFSAKRDDQPAHATKKSPSQLDREIAEALSGRRSGSRAHATKARDKTSDKINIDQLAEMFGLPDWDRVDEMNQTHYWEMSRGAEDEDAQMKAEQEAQEEVYRQWYDAVEHVGNKLFGEHDLELKPTGKQGTKDRRYDFKITPANSWNDAADKIRETINGVGDFHFSSLKEFLDSGPYTARSAVLSHLGYIKHYPAVYGGQGARQMYDRAW